MTPVVVAFETGGCRFAAQIAVDALIVDVEWPRYVFGVFVCDVGHSFTVKVKFNISKRTLSAQLNRRRRQGRLFHFLVSMK
jgi:hypothetical protein